MQTLHVISDLDHGGAQTQVRLLAEAGVARGDQVTVASLRRPGPVADRLRASGVGVLWLRRRFRVDPFALGRLTQWARGNKPDAIQSWDSSSAAFCEAARRLVDAPWVQTIREADAARRPGADGWIVSDPSRGSDGEVVPNAIDPSITPATGGEKHAARSRLHAAGVSVTDEAPVVLIVARLDRPQAVNELVWAADLVRVVCPGLRVLVAGAGPARQSCQRFAAAAVEPGLVTWLGAWDDLATAYAAADVVWCGAGGGAEPTPALEALAAGKPLVLAQAPGREALAPSEDGLACLLRWNDRPGWARTTKRLLDDAKLAGRIGRANAARVREGHAIQAVAQRHSEALRSVALNRFAAAG